METKRIANIGLLTALIVVGRNAFTFLPNVQPMTAIIILITLHIGVKDGLLVATLSLLISNLTLGMGVWTVAQITSFAFIVLLTGAIKGVQKYIPLQLMAIYSGAMGMFYGLIISLVQAPFFGWASFLPYYISGIPYDFYHAIGNVGFYYILAPLLTPVLSKYKMKTDD